MSREIVTTEDAPAAVGPYSQGIATECMVFTAGQAGIVPGTKEFAGPDVESQTRQTLQNIEAILKAAGSGMRHVVKTTVFLVDINEFSRMNQVYAEFFAEEPPARTTVQVAALPMGARVEIDAVAQLCDCS